MLKKLGVIIFCAAAFFLFAAKNAAAESPLLQNEMAHVLAGGQPFVVSGYDSCAIWLASAKDSKPVFEYRINDKNEKWIQIKDVKYFTKKINGKEYSGYFANIPKLYYPPKRYSSRAGFEQAHVAYALQIKCGNKIIHSSKFVKVSKKRLDVIKPVALGKLLLRPTFNSCGFYFGTKRVDNIAVEFKKSSAKNWNKALVPEFFFESLPPKIMSEYRGSIVKLEEDTSYDIRILSNGKKLVQGTFKTWKSDVPVAKTIIIDPAKFNSRIVISDKGTPDGWIRYTAPKGTVLKSKRSVPMIEIRNARYVLLDDMVISGGPSKDVITIHNSEAVRIRNCEITNWGIIGTPRYDQFGRYFTKQMNRKQYGINWNGAIAIHEGSSKVVVERCYIHSPRNRANSWYYSHPAGPQAIMLYRPAHSTVIRYNDFVGSDRHRFNDAVESVGNFDADGGINRDADVYGNYMIYCNDDNIELDGGHQNVRCYWNHFEGALCGVSIQGLMTSPVYVFENIFAGMCEQFGIAGQTIKTTGVLTGDNATAYIFNNTLVRDGTGVDIHERMNMILYNNIFSDERERISIKPHDPSPRSIFVANTVETDRQNKWLPGITKGKVQYKNYANGNYLPLNAEKAEKIANFLPEGGIRGAFQLKNTLVLPMRPIPFTLDRTRIGEVSLKNGTATPSEITITATVGGKNFKSAYSVRQNPDFNWFEVTPSKGVMKSGDKITFKVKFIPSKMKVSHNLRGAFLIRLENGFSRPVTVLAETDFVEPFKCDKKGDFAIYIDAFKPSKVYRKNGKSGKFKTIEDKLGKDGKFVVPRKRNIYEYQVNVPKDGRYYFMLHGRADKGIRIMACVDNGKFETSRQQFRKNYTTWTMITPGRSFGNMCRHYDLKKGVHTLKITASDEGSPVYDGIVLTDNPESFEPRP